MKKVITASIADPRLQNAQNVQDKLNEIEGTLASLQRMNEQGWVTDENYSQIMKALTMADNLMDDFVSEFANR